eukprot:TRINITY_DN5436_c0_g1_i1.p2 TRINITY_DN5436_c0_g1~~TRINITY_DN5436_c0_g1_i1.p2  ORF type:complete len:122 (-),score=9.12 TRINITY_DN5436_c0_g1_i1:790-1155(-)
MPPQPNTAQRLAALEQRVADQQQVIQTLQAAAETNQANNAKAATREKVANAEWQSSGYVRSALIRGGNGYVGCRSCCSSSALGKWRVTSDSFTAMHFAYTAGFLKTSHSSTTATSSIGIPT